MSFIEEINKITKEYRLANYNQFNIFKIMFKQHDEKYLHSRFIAFLLDPNGSHKQGTLFLEFFLQVMGISNFSLDGIRVNPTEVERSEVYNIDILIRNSLNQAIIIENKFFAKDQTKPDSEEIAKEPLLKYQLTRYYLKIAIEKKYEIVKMIYLSIDGKNPEDFNKFPDVVKSLIDKKDHLSDIATWLDLCLEKLTTDSDLKRSVEQYKQARFQFLNDVQLALRLKELTAQYIDEAKPFWLANYELIDSELHFVKNQFIHVKWHVVHEFYAELQKLVEETFQVTVNEINKEQITKLTHLNRKIPTSLTFEINGIIYYVCNDENGFSFGSLKQPQKEKKFEFLFKDRHYGWFDFTNDEVFELIKPEKRDELVGQMVDQLKDFVNK